MTLIQKLLTLHTQEEGHMICTSNVLDNKLKAEVIALLGVYLATPASPQRQERLAPVLVLLHPIQDRV